MERCARLWWRTRRPPKAPRQIGTLVGRHTIAIGNR
jgi:hypothetical protein